MPHNIFFYIRPNGRRHHNQRRPCRQRSKTINTELSRDTMPSEERNWHRDRYYRRRRRSPNGRRYDASDYDAQRASYSSSSSSSNNDDNVPDFSFRPRRAPTPPPIWRNRRDGDRPEPLRSCLRNATSTPSWRRQDLEGIYFAFAPEDGFYFHASSGGSGGVDGDSTLSLYASTPDSHPCIFRQLGSSHTQLLLL